MVTGGGRFIGYSAAKQSDTNPVTDQQEIVGFTYNTLAPGAIVPATYNGTQNTWVYDSASGTITIVANNQSMTYGGTVPAFTYQFTCSSGCLQSSVMSGSLTTNASTSTSGNYNTNAYNGNSPWSILQGTLADNNGYTINFTAGTFAVTPKTLTVSGMLATSKTYDGTATAAINNAGDTLVGIVSGFHNAGGGPVDSVTLNTATTATFASRNVGNQTVTGSGFSVSGLDANDYSLSQPTATATISPLAITITANAQNATYGDTLGA